MHDRMQRSEKGKEQDFAEKAWTDSGGLLREFWDFLCFNKKWWLLPIIVVLLLVGVLVFFVGGSAPFIYALF